jgi:hypothetical protein
MRSLAQSASSSHLKRQSSARALRDRFTRCSRIGTEVVPIGGDGELDIVQPGTSQAEFYRLSAAAMADQLITAGVMAANEAAELEAWVNEPDFLGSRFACIGAWGRRPS